MIFKHAYLPTKPSRKLLFHILMYHIRNAHLSLIIHYFVPNINIIFMSNRSIMVIHKINSYLKKTYKSFFFISSLQKMLTKICVFIETSKKFWWKVVGEERSSIQYRISNIYEANIDDQYLELIFSSVFPNYEIFSFLTNVLIDGLIFN